MSYYIASNKVVYCLTITYIFQNEFYILNTFFELVDRTLPFVVDVHAC